MAGDVADFDPTQDYHWTFLTAPRGMSGYNPANISIDRSGFTNPIEGQFSVSRVGNNLVLNYSVPEPGTLALAALGSFALLMIGRLRWH